MRYCLFFYWRNFICARNKFLWINKITSLRDLRNVPNYFFLWEVNLKDLTSSQIEKTSSQYCFDTLTNTKLRMFFKGENNSFSSDDWASVFYFLNINLIGLRSQNISEDKKKQCNFSSSIFDVATNLILYFVYAGTPQSHPQCCLLHSSRNIMRKHKDETCIFVQIVKSIMSWIQPLQFIISTLEEQRQK